MNETSVPVPPAGAPSAEPPPRSGLLKWGLVGCGVLSAVLIVGMVLFFLKAKDITGSLLRKTEEMVVQQCTPEVTEPQKEAFKGAYEAFIAAASAGKVPYAKMTAVRTKLLDAVGDGKVTPQEIDALTVSVRENTPP